MAEETGTLSRITRNVRLGLMIVLAWALPMAAGAAPFAAFVMDARTGKEIYSQNADTHLHPASLTKMMTLYLAFTAIEKGQVRLDSKFRVSSHAASQPPSRLGLRPGQEIELRYLIRAAAVKSANDAATTIGEGLGGSEAKFAAQMNAMAAALGMKNTHFVNANGLTTEGHYSSARDLTILGRRLFYDFPQYYSIFSRRTADAGIATVSSTNRRFLDGYEGADGIKTGYTRAAGFNLTASAKRGSRRLVATVMGGNSTAHRNAVMAQLLDAGFGSASPNAREVRPNPPDLLMVERNVTRRVQVARAEPVAATPAPVTAAASTVSLSSSDRPVARGSTAGLVTSDQIATAMARATRNAASDDAVRRPQRRPAPPVATASTKGADALVAVTPRPDPRPEGDAPSDLSAPVARPDPAPRREDSSASLEPAGSAAPASFAPASFAPASLLMLSPVAESAAPPAGEPAEAGGSMALLGSAAPPRRQEGIILAAMDPVGDEPAPVETVSRAASRGQGHGISLGLHASRREAEQLLLRTALQESTALGNATSRVLDTKRGFEPSFVGMSRERAELACSRLAARHQPCEILAP